MRARKQWLGVAFVLSIVLLTVQAINVVLGARAFYEWFVLCGPWVNVFSFFELRRPSATAR